MIELTALYPVRNIEGIDKNEILSAFEGRSMMFSKMDAHTLVHRDTGRRVVFECVQKYFEPVKSYYKLDDKSSCEFVQHAMNLRASGCDNCLCECIRAHKKIKPSKVRISADYFNK